MAPEEVTPSSDRVPFFKEANRIVFKTVLLAAVAIAVVFTFHSALQHSVIPGMNKTLSSWSSLIGQIIRDNTVPKSFPTYTTRTSSDDSSQVPEPPNVIVCKTSECKDFGASTTRRLQHSRIHPCHDFYSHVCASWERDHPVNEYEKQSVSFDTVTMKHYAELLKAGLKSTNPRSKLALAYNLCQKKSDTLFSELVQTFLYTLGFDRWPYTVHSAWGLSVDELSYKVGSVYRELGLDSLFSFSVDEDEQNRSRPLLTLGQPHLVSVYVQNETDGYLWLDKSFRLLAESLGKAYTSRGDIARLERNLQSFMVAEEHECSADCDTVKVEKLPAVPLVNWTSLFRGVFGTDLTIEKVRLTSPRYLFNVYKNLDASNACLLNYLVFRIMMYLLPFHKDDAILIKLGRWKMYRQPSFSLEFSREDQCLHLMLSTEPYLPMVLVRDAKPKRVSSTSFIQDMVQRSLPSAFAAYVHKHIFLQARSKIKFLDLLEDIKWEPFIPSALQNRSFQTIYANDIYTKDSGAPILYLLFYYIKNSARARRYSPVLNHDIPSTDWSLGFFDTYPRLDPPFRKLQIPLAALNPLLPNDPLVNLFQIPRLAFRTYRCLFDFLCHFSRSHHNHNLTETLSATSSCLRIQYSQLKIPGTGQFANAERTSQSDLLDALSLRVAYEAFREKVGRSAAGLSIAGASPYNLDALFFVHYAESFCQSATEEHKRSFLSRSSHSPPWLRVNGPLRNNVNFARAFRCPADTFMNPKSICYLQ